MAGGGGTQGAGGHGGFCAFDWSAPGECRFCDASTQVTLSDGKHSQELKSNAPKWCQHKPDKLKLMRSTEDALTGIIWGDDAQDISGSVDKCYGEKPGLGYELINYKW